MYKISLAVKNKMFVITSQIKGLRIIVICFAIENEANAKVKIEFLKWPLAPKSSPFRF